MSIDKNKYPLNYGQALIVMESGGMVAGTVEDLPGFELVFRMNEGNLQVHSSPSQKWENTKESQIELKAASYRMTDRTFTKEEAEKMATDTVKIKTGIDIKALEKDLKESIGEEKYNELKAQAEAEYEARKKGTPLVGGAAVGTTMTTVITEWNADSFRSIFRPFFGMKTKITMEVLGD